MLVNQRKIIKQVKINEEKLKKKELELYTVMNWCYLM